MSARPSHHSLNEYGEFLTPAQVCEVTGKSKNTVYDTIKRGDIPHIKVGVRGLLVPRSFFQIATAAAVQP